MTEPKRVSETREEGDVNPRAIESVKDYIHERMKMSEKQKGILHREEGKLVIVERQPQTEGAVVLGRTKGQISGGADNSVSVGCTGDGMSEQAGPHKYGPTIRWSMGEEKSAGGCWRRRAQQNFSPSRGP